jgi:allophanate hydrolase
MMQLPQKLTIAALRGMYANGETTPEAVVKELVQRAEEDRDMNIWITAPSLEAAAPYLERLKDTKPGTLPLWGIPFAIKDNIDLAGVPTTAGCPEFSYIPESNAVVIQRLIEAGAIPLGKTNLDQFATGLVGTRSPYGETHNALKPELISGGSNSGSATAVARGHCVFALGTDTAGSGRIPAALNRLVGFKSSLGAWPTKGVIPACESLDCVTVFTNELQEIVEVDQAVRGYEASDPWSRHQSSLSARTPTKLCLPKEPLSFFGPYAFVCEAYSEAGSEDITVKGGWRFAQ